MAMTCAVGKGLLRCGVLAVMLVALSSGAGRVTGSVADVGAAAPVGFQLAEVRGRETVDLRGFGRVSASGRLWTDAPGRQAALVTFQSQNAELAKVLASKYVADMLAYGAVEKTTTPAGIGGTGLSVRHGGEWLVGVDGSRVLVASAPDKATLAKMSVGWGAATWQSAPENTHPRWLDCFDNAGLGFRWKGFRKTAEQMDWIKDMPVVTSVHTRMELSRNPAAGVYDRSGSELALEKLRRLDKPTRFIAFSSIHGADGIWFNPLRASGHHLLELPSGSSASFRDFFAAGGYYWDFGSSPTASALLQASLLDQMRTLDHPGVLGWMEPHGEFSLARTPMLTPGYQTRFPAYLQMVKGYSLDTLSESWFGKRDALADWNQIPFPDLAYFYGRRGVFLDLDDLPWKWKAGTMEAGEADGWARPGFDDASWAEDLRDSKLLLSQFTGSPPLVYPLWYRFSHEVPASFLNAAREAGGSVYLHIMPANEPRDEKGAASVWINGREVASGVGDTAGRWWTEHCQVEVGTALKQGVNHFAIYSHGGRIAYRVFLSTSRGEIYPFAEDRLNRQYLDWKDYQVWEMGQVLEDSLKLMRSVDPDRPIMVMTPQVFPNAWSLMERYGAYPFLTGQGSHYRPYNHKGYTALRRLPAGGEPGGAQLNARNSQKMFATIFWESKDVHDHVFDLSENWPRKSDGLWDQISDENQRGSWVKWWTDNRVLLGTLGKTDFADFRLGVLRDNSQDVRFGNHAIFNWDIARGSLPGMGLSPVLADGQDFRDGLADGVPVIFDCATTVMEPAMVDAVLRYVRKGGVFIAQHHTGQHLADRQNAYPLAAALGLRITPKLIADGSIHRWPIGKLRFTDDQSLIPSLRGRMFEGGGVSIDHLNQEHVGAVSIASAPGQTPDVVPVATYEDDGTMAIAEVRLGKGRLIWLGMPFHLRMKDVNGSFLNDQARQSLLEEMLARLGVKRDTEVSDPRVWFERRESKNGLYDVYIACAMGVGEKDWSLNDRIETDLRVRREASAPFIEITAADTPDAPVRYDAGVLDLGKQSFSPYQVRQWAVVREDAGLEAPLHWLETQRRHWRALEPVPASVADGVLERAAHIADSMGEAGLNIREGWKVRIDPKNVQDESWVAAPAVNGEWRDGALGAWVARGWDDALCVQYRRQVAIPEDWCATPRRILLGIMGYEPNDTIKGRAKLWVNGKLLDGNVNGFVLYDVSGDLRAGALDLALQVEAPPDAVDRGPVGTMYLRAMPAPDYVADISGGWLDMTDWSARGATPVQIPMDGKIQIFGLRRVVSIPEQWDGKPVRLVVDSGQPNPGGARPSGIIINRTGYFRADGWQPIGPRIDKWLHPGEENEIILLGDRHVDSQNYQGFSPIVQSIRLEVYPR